MPGNPTLRKTTLCDRVCEGLRDALLNGQYQPGDRLPSEGELGEIFDVGRGSVREALKRLEMIGLVHIIHGRGVLVADHDAIQQRLRFLSPALILSAPQAAEVLDVLRCLERVALQHSLASHTTDTETLAAIVNAMEHDDTNLPSLANRFLAALVATNGNNVLIQIHQVLRDILDSTPHDPQPDLPPRMIRQACQQILHAIATGDPRLAEQNLSTLQDVLTDAWTSPEAEVS